MPLMLPPRPFWSDPGCISLLALVLLAGLGFLVASRSGGGRRRAWLACGLASLAVMPLILLLVPSVARVREAGPRTMNQNNLKQIALAFHNYAASHGDRFPPAVARGRDGQPLLSWRVLLLPYLEQEDLYKQFRLDEAWDSPHNILLLPRMPKVYAPVGANSKARPHETFYRVFVGPGAAFEGKEGLQLPDDFPDGTSNTILVAEAGEAVPWSKPEELPYDPDSPLPRLGGLGLRDRFAVAFADGSAREIKRDAGEQAIRALITRNGGEALGPDW